MTPSTSRSARSRQLCRVQPGAATSATRATTANRGRQRADPCMLHPRKTRKSVHPAQTVSASQSAGVEEKGAKHATGEAEGLPSLPRLAAELADDSPRQLVAL